MKAKLVKTDHSPISTECVVEIGLLPGESDHLRQALALVYKYKKLACQVSKLNPKGSDWHMVEYSVKNDKVIVTVLAGMAG